MSNPISAGKKLTSLTFFFPAYNEEENIEESVQQAIDVAEKVTDDYEIIVINDGSKDRTKEVIQRLDEANPRVHLVDHPENRGYGEALMSGFKAATKEWVFFTDVDLQFDLQELPKLVEQVDEYDVILGYRIKRGDPFMRLLNAKGWNLLNRLFFGLKVKDIDCAYKLIRRSVLQPILPQMITGGAMLSAELLIRIFQAGHKHIEVGVHHYPRQAGSPTGAHPAVIIRAFKEFWQVYRSGIGRV